MNRGHDPFPARSHPFPGNHHETYPDPFPLLYRSGTGNGSGTNSRNASNWETNAERVQP